MNLNEETKDTKLIYQGKIVTLRVDDVLLPNGKFAKREIVEHPGGVGILAVNENNKIIMVKQYRKPAEKVMIEIPAGKLEYNEDPSECAKRELMEETGYIAKNVKHLFSFYPSPGFSKEVLHLYLADDIKKGEPHRDDDEFLEIQECSIEEIKNMLKDKIIDDAKTLIAILYFINTIE